MPTPDYPIHFPPEGPILPETKDVDRTGGHPTVPGDLDKKFVQKRATGESPGNGYPGRPRYKKLAPRHGPGIPGPTPSGPVQPGVDYDSGKDA